MNRHVASSAMKGALVGLLIAILLDAATFGYLGFSGFIYQEGGGLIGILVATVLGAPLNLFLVNTLDSLPHPTSVDAWFNVNRYLEIGIIVNASLFAASLGAFREHRALQLRLRATKPRSEN